MWRALFFSFLFFFSFDVASAQTLHQEVQEQVSARVIEVLNEHEREIVGTGATTTVQEVRVELLEGDKAGEVVRFESELVRLEKGDHIFVYRMQTVNGQEFYSFANFERRYTLLFVAGLFVFMLLIFSRWQGVRALLSLVGSVAVILFILVPALLKGYDPTLVSLVVSGAVLAMVLFVTHGFNARTSIAFFGTFSAVTLTSLIAWLSFSAMRLTGFSSDASVYLNFATGGQLDLAGLLLGSIIIGILGMLDDVSITQASVVEELKRANQTLGFKELYDRAIKVGRDHIGSLVNTLALAYVGVSLPLILLYAQANSDVWMALNQEVVAVELLRIIVGSIGLVMAVPATTAVAAWWYHERVLIGEGHDCGHHHHH